MDAGCCYGGWVVLHTLIYCFVLFSVHFNFHAHRPAAFTERPSVKLHTTLLANVRWQRNGDVDVVAHIRMSGKMQCK